MMSIDVRDQPPSVERPMLLGLLVDVSSSMLTLLPGSSDQAQRTRIQGFSDALDGLVERAVVFCESESGAQIAPKVSFFAYGFGFGNLIGRMLGRTVPEVMDLLDLPGSESSTVSIDQLAHNWQEYHDHIGHTTRDMLGFTTPMLTALETAQARFQSERRSSRWCEQPLLFVLSDGEPTGPDGTAQKIIEIADQLRSDDILIGTCLISDEIPSVASRTLYKECEPDWPDAAKLMFECSSPLNEDSPYRQQLTELHWNAKAGTRLFTAIDAYEQLPEFLNATLSRLRPRTGEPTSASPRCSPERATAEGLPAGNAEQSQALRPARDAFAAGRDVNIHNYFTGGN